KTVLGGRHESDPPPDVCAAALSMRIGGDWRMSRKDSIYRGQRSAIWRVVPSLYRPPRDGSLPDIDKRWQRTSQFAASVGTLYPDLSPDQCLAVAQHYSAEADTPTHLID